MPDYTDLTLRYEPGSTVARLLFDHGLQVVRFDVVPEAVSRRISTAQELTDALAIGEPRLALDPAVFVGNFVVTHPVVLSGPDAWLRPADPLLPALVVLADDVTVRQLGAQPLRSDRDVIQVGSQAATSADQQPHRVRFEDVEVRATPSGGHRAFALHGTDIVLERVRVTGFLESGRDSQAVWINNGPGPYSLIDCYLEASGENIMLGGAPVNIPGCVPSDVIIHGCTLYKPQAWRNVSGSVKNLLEVKNGRRVLVENCILDGCWKDAQQGTPIVLTCKPQSTASDPPMPWGIVDDIILRHNVVRNCPDSYAVSILGHSSTGASQQTQRITLDHNLFEDCSRGVIVQRGVAALLTITNNTWPVDTHSMLVFDGLDANGQPYGGVYTPCTIERNVFRSGAYGIKGTGTGSGTPSLAWWSNGNYAMTSNVIEKTATIPWPPGQTLLPPGGLAQALDPVTFKYLPDPTVGY